MTIFILPPLIKKLGFTSLVAAIFLMSASHSGAKIKSGIDLEAVMKQMRFEYIQAVKAPTASVFNRRMWEFKRQLDIAQQFEFTKQRREKATEGLNKVASVINKLNLPVSAANLKAAKKSIEFIDDLRRQYHDKKPSLWERFFELFFGPNKENEALILLDDS